MSGVARCVSQYGTWIDVSVSVGDRQGCTVTCVDFESITCTRRSIQRVERCRCVILERILMCSTWEV